MPYLFYLVPLLSTATITHSFCLPGSASLVPALGQGGPGSHFWEPFDSALSLIVSVRESEPPGASALLSTHCSQSCLLRSRVGLGCSWVNPSEPQRYSRSLLRI